MKNISTLLALTLVAATPAFAQGPLFNDVAEQVSSTKTRDQVRADLVQARKDGSIRYHSTSYNALAEAKSLKSREEVVAEARQARDADFAAQFYGEDSGSFYLARTQGGAADSVYAGTPKTVR